MKQDVGIAIGRGIVKRREILTSLTTEERTSLLEELFLDLFGRQHLVLQKWAALTGQSAQVDTGYIAQFVASIVLGEPGQGFRGKGDDLADGSEVKGAANISGVDRPRWNHNFGTIAEDAVRRAQGKLTKAEEYLNVPYLFYLLVDRVVGSRHGAPVRVRAWCLNAHEDEAWRNLIHVWLEERKAKTYNFQLHPPVGYDDDVVVNSLGNLDFADALVLDARIVIDDAGSASIKWHVPLKEQECVRAGRSHALPYGGRSARKSRLTGVSDLVVDVTYLPTLFPGILSDQETVAIREAVQVDAVVEIQEVGE